MVPVLNDPLRWDPYRADVEAKAYRCGHCDHQVSSVYGMRSNLSWATLRVCPHCMQPTYFRGDQQYPGAKFGNPVAHLPQEIEQAYDEARRCVSVSAYTSTVLMCRKLLMHIAVAQGANPGESFLFYINHLAGAGFIPPNGRHWVDRIRQKGNEATHELPAMTHADAEELLSFLEMLLKFIYEFPSRIAPPTP